MSLTRQFLREFRPLFRMLEEPFGRSAVSALPRNSNSPFAIFNDPFFSNPIAALPAIDLAEEGNHYVVEAELPGVKKENVDIRIGDNGQSLTIEGKTFTRSAPAQIEGQAQDGQQQVTAPSEGTSTNDTQAVTQTNDGTSTQLSTERSFTGSSSFSRTIWLPRKVDASGVSAKLLDGILTVRIPKMEDQESVKVNIE